MWLHIRGVGEWTNRLYAYFEREQERLHSGQVPASVPGCSNDLPLKSETPQKDFLAKNLARIANTPNANDCQQNISNEPSSQLNRYSNGTSVHSEDELNGSTVHPPLRPPRSGQSTSKLATDSFTASRPPKFERQTSETAQTAIRKIQASLQRTFSRKGSTSGATSSNGTSNDGFVGDEMTVDLMHKGKRKMITKNKTPLEKSLSMPDIEIRNKKRERLLA